MVGAKFKFSQPTERIPTRGSKTQGLRGNKVKLAGNSKKKKQQEAVKKPSKKPTFTYLKTNRSSFPGGKENVFEQMARGDLSDEEEDEFDDGASEAASSLASSASAMSGSGSYISAASSGRYSGSSLGSSGSSVPVDKSFDIIRDSSKPSTYGLTTAEAEEAEKQDILGRLFALRSRGVRLSKNYTMRSSLQELRMEMGRIEHEQETSRSVQRLRRWLLAGVSGAQYATSSKFAPKIIKGRLDGFSNYVLNNLEEYDPVFERMSERYGGVLGIGSTGNPLGDLFMLLATQMLMFVFLQHKSGVKPPSEEEVKREYPDMIRKMATEMADKMRQDEKAREQTIRAEEMQRLREQYQQPVRQHDTAPYYNAPPQTPYYQSPPQRRTNVMPGPSFDLSSAFAPSEEVKSEEQDMYDLMQGAQREEIYEQEPDPFQMVAQQEKMEDLHAATTPTQQWLPEELDHTAEAKYQEDVSTADLPEYEPIVENTFPQRPKTVSKLIEMPTKTVSTRKGRAVKETAVIKKEESKTGGNVLSIS